MRLFLRDILEEKRRRGDADAEQFRRVVSYEFAAGLSATAEGAARAMRRWVDSRPAWVSDAQHAGRVAVLAAIEETCERNRHSVDQIGLNLARLASAGGRGSGAHWTARPVPARETEACSGYHSA